MRRTASHDTLPFPILPKRRAALALCIFRCNRSLLMCQMTQLECLLIAGVAKTHLLLPPTVSIAIVSRFAAGQANQRRGTPGLAGQPRRFPNRPARRRSVTKRIAVARI